MKKIRILAFVCAIVTAFALFFFLKSIRQPGTVEKTGVLVATVDITSNTTVTKDMVTIKYIPNEAVYSETVKNSAQIIGKVATTDIVKGEQIISSKFAAAGKSGADTLAYAIEPGMRAITIVVDDVSGLSGMLKPGNQVDIISILSNDNNKTVFTKMLLENITVLAVDSVISEQGKAKNKDGTTASYTSITLEVIPEQAMKLSLSEYKGKLKVILRSPIDSGVNSIPDLTLGSLLK